MSVEIPELPILADDIQKTIPHRYPFLLIDRITEFVPEELITGVKCVSGNEPFFQGHFPGKPIMPGVLILEALAQIGVFYATLAMGGLEGKILVFSGAEGLRFRRQVVPGDVLKLHLHSPKRRMGHWKLKGEATVEGELACQATIMATEVPIS